MTAALVPYGELEVEDEAPAHEYEGEWEVAHEDEDEAEEFFGALASLASRPHSTPTLRRVGLTAARAALNAGGRAFSDQTGGFSKQAAGYLSSLLPQSEMEAEGEDFADPFRRVYPNRPLMEHIGHAAAEAEDEDEAEALVGSLVPLAARAAPALDRATPQLTKAVSAISRQLRANPSTRPLVRALPSIVARTAHTVNRHAAAGHRITPQRAVHTLARHTARTLGNPRQLVHDYRRSQHLEHRHHARGGAPATHRQGYRHPGYRGVTGTHRYGPYGWWRPGRSVPGYTPGVPHAHPHPHAQTPPHVPHSHAHPHAPGAPAPATPYGGIPWRRYAPPPGVRVPGPPPGPYAGPGTATWTCTCQWS